MTARYTIGIEEEFQLVDRNTGQLSPQVMTILKKGASIFGEQIKPEMLQPTVELISHVYPDIMVARSETRRLRAELASLLAQEDLALISAGTHPGGIWMDQPVTPNPRYHELLEELQDVGRAILIFGLHVHVAVESNEIALASGRAYRAAACLIVSRPGVISSIMYRRSSIRAALITAKKSGGISVPILFLALSSSVSSTCPSRSMMLLVLQPSANRWWQRFPG